MKLIARNKNLLGFGTINDYDAGFGGCSTVKFDFMRIFKSVKVLRIGLYYFYVLKMK